MIALPETITLPLKMDEHGTIRISNTRVTLDTIIACHQQGDTPESIHVGFPTVPLNDIYAAIGYYLSHQDELDSYLKQGEEAAAEIRQKIEARYTPEQKSRTEYFRNLLAQQSRDQET